jgi:hypothetical protein
MRGEGFDRGEGIFPPKQLRQRGNVFAPGQFFHQVVQIDEPDVEWIWPGAARANVIRPTSR